MFDYEPILRYIEENLQSEISLDDLAQQANYSKHHFCHLFKETMGQSVGSFIKRRRLLQILLELQQGRPTAETVLRYGFDSYAGFYKAFVQMFGHSPRVYLDLHKNDMPLNMMEAQPMIPLETPRCTLVLLTENDIPEALPLLTDSQVRHYLGGPVPEKAAVERLQRWIRQPDSIYYTVRLRNTAALMGIVDISPHHNLVDKEISYQFLPEYWGNGYAAEVIGWILHHCKSDLHVKSVVSETQSANLRSCRLLQRLGYYEQEHLIRFGAEQIIFRKQL